MPYIGNTTTSFNVDSNNINNGSITTEKIAAGAVVNADVNDSASIAGTKISADFGAQNLVVDTSLLFVNATNDRVGIGTNSPAYALDVKQSNTANSNTIAAKGGTNGGGYFWETNAGTTYGAIGYGDLISANSGSSNTAITSWGAQDLLLGTNRTERLRIDSSGRLLVGTSTSRDNWFNGSSQSPVIQSESSSFQNLFSGTYTSSGNGAPIALLGKARGTSYQVVNDADGLGRISFQGADGAQMVEAAFILAEVDGTPGANDMPGRLVFSTTADGASSPTERMRIDASGNITLPSGGNLGINGALPQSPLDVISNASSYGISLRGRSSDNVSQFRFVSNNHGSVYSLFESALTYLATHVNGSERLRIDSSGRLLIGTSSDRSNVPGASVGVLIEGASGANTNKRFVQHIFGSGDGSGPYLGLGKHRGTSIGGNTLVVNGDELGGIYFQGADGSNFIQGASIMSFVDGTPGTNDMPARLVFSTTSDGSPNPTVRMRIGSDGFVKIGTPVSPSGAASSTGFSFMEGSNFNWSTNGGNAYWNASTDTYLNFRRNGTQVGNINWTSSATAFVTSSDYRMKENVVTLDGAIDRVKQLLPKRFNFIVAPDKTVDGFLAHEAQAVVPEAVTGIKDELEVWTVDDTLPEGVSVGDNKLDDNGNTIPKYQGIDQAKLVPLLTAALQEAIGRIETLEGMVAVNNITIDEQQHQLSTLAARLTALESA